jgi:xanthine/uracil/vitamin C permease (AzgA family)
MSERNDDVPASKISKLFDIRLIVGGLLVIYGAVLTIKGAIDTTAAVRKAAGIRLNLWTGLGMLVVGLLMLLWMRLRPLASLESEDIAEEEGPGESRES